MSCIRDDCSVIDRCTHSNVECVITVNSGRDRVCVDDVYINTKHVSVNKLQFNFTNNSRIATAIVS